MTEANRRLEGSTQPPPSHALQSETRGRSSAPSWQFGTIVSKYRADTGAGAPQVTSEYVVSVTLPGTPEHFTREFHEPVVVGRAPESGLQLLHPLVSRRHVELSLTDGGRFSVRDLGSSNGTIVNDNLIKDAEAEVLAPAVVQVGPYLLTLTPADLLAEATLRQQPPAPRKRLTLDRGLHVLLVDNTPAIEGLTGLEYRLVDLLIEADGRLVAVKDIGDILWGVGAWDPYMLHNLVRRVRRKLEEKGHPGDALIVSVPGGGYHIT